MPPGRPHLAVTAPPRPGLVVTVARFATVMG